MTESRERFIEMRQELYRHAAPKPTTARCKYCAALKKFKPKEGVRASGKPSPAPKAAPMAPSAEAQNLEDEINKLPF